MRSAGILEEDRKTGYDMDVAHKPLAQTLQSQQVSKYRERREKRGIYRTVFNSCIFRNGGKRLTDSGCFKLGKCREWLYDHLSVSQPPVRRFLVGIGNIRGRSFGGFTVCHSI